MYNVQWYTVSTKIQISVKKIYWTAYANISFYVLLEASTNNLELLSVKTGISGIHL
jgi:hypothetical protein